jgi:hypothetical protein
MKKLALISLFLLLILIGTAKSQIFQTNFQKYWYYRDRFVHDFTRIGPGPGSSVDTKNRVPGTGFEPAHLAAPPPQSGASTNFATRANKLLSLVSLPYDEAGI